MISRHLEIQQAFLESILVSRGKITLSSTSLQLDLYFLKQNVTRCQFKCVVKCLVLIDLIEYHRSSVVQILVL